MKKLLSIAFCAAAALAASAAETISTNLTTVVGVIPVTLPAGQQNTIISAAFKGLDGNANTIANFIKTTNLAEGDKLLLFNNGVYSAWVLDSNKKWAKTESNFTLDATGTATVTQGAETSTTVTDGQGLWIIRQNPEEAATIAIYGQYVAKQTFTIAAKTWTLMGNANLYEEEIKDAWGAKGAKFITVVGGALREYNYSVTKAKWYYQTYTDGVRTVIEDEPLMQPGFGCWVYLPAEQTFYFNNYSQQN